MATITSADLIADLKQVFDKTGSYSRKNYRMEGTYSERQARKVFGNFSSFQQAAGFTNEPVTKPEPVADATGYTGTTGTNEYVGDTWNAVRKTTEPILSLEDLIEFFEVDTEIWEVERWKANTWDANAGNGTTMPLYQVTATFKKKRAAVFAKNEIADIKKRALEELSMQAAGFKNSFSPKVYRETRLSSGNMLEINVPDLHAGKLAWSKETGYGNYDTTIALDLFETAVLALLARNAHITFDRIVFVVGNDLSHSDTIGGTTTRGTQLDNDSRYHKVFVRIRERLVKIIREYLLPVAPVTIIGCPGNHDKTTAWHIVDSLEQRFFDNADVEVMNDPVERKYFQWGEVLLMFTHGDTGKKADYPLTMAQEEKVKWGNSTYREIHTGHIHQTMLQEFHGVRVRVLPALCEPDAWHAASNFVGNLRTAEAYAWNNKTGLINQAFYNAD